MEHDTKETEQNSEKAEKAPEDGNGNQDAEEGKEWLARYQKIGLAFTPYDFSYL